MQNDVYDEEIEIVIHGRNVDTHPLNEEHDCDSSWPSRSGHTLELQQQSAFIPTLAKFSWFLKACIVISTACLFIIGGKSLVNYRRYADITTSGRNLSVATSSPPPPKWWMSTERQNEWKKSLEQTREFHHAPPKAQRQGQQETAADWQAKVKSSRQTVERIKEEAQRKKPMAATPAQTDHYTKGQSITTAVNAVESKEKKLYTVSGQQFQLVNGVQDLSKHKMEKVSAKEVKSNVPQEFEELLRFIQILNAKESEDLLPAEERELRKLAHNYFSKTESEKLPWDTTGSTKKQLKIKEILRSIWSIHREVFQLSQ